MEKERLIERLNFVMGKKDVLALAEIFAEIENGVSILFELCQLENEKLSFHAAWVLENVFTLNPDLFYLNLSKIVELLPTFKSQSLLRHFCKLLSFAMEDYENNRFPKEVSQLFQKLDMELVIESCFDSLMNPISKPAVKAHCMDILLSLSRRYDWIADELPYVLELQMLDATPGVKNKGVKVLEMLRKRKVKNSMLNQKL